MYILTMVFPRRRVTFRQKFVHRIGSFLLGKKLESASTIFCEPCWAILSPSELFLNASKLQTFWGATFFSLKKFEPRELRPFLVSPGESLWALMSPSEFFWAQENWRSSLLLWKKFKPSKPQWTLVSSSEPLWFIFSKYFKRFGLHYTVCKRFD